MKNVKGLLLLACSLCILSSGVCWADQVTFATSTTLGCFTSSTCTPTLGTSATTDLTFAGSSFGQPNGQTSVGGSVKIPLGTFTLTDHNSAFINTHFDSLVTFTLPVIITGSQSNSFNALVLGVVGRNLAGAVFINFDNTLHHFTFSNSQYSGSFDFSVGDLLFAVVGNNGSSTVTWYGQVTNAVETKASAIAEPGSLALLLAGSLVLLWSRRRAGLTLSPLA